MKRHFVVFYSPGTFFSEQTSKPISSWDVEKAKEMAKDVTERHNATPFGFQFVTRERGPKDLDGHEIKRSGMYFLGGKVKTLDDVLNEHNPENSTLISNMKNNHFDKVVVNDNSYRVTQPLGPNDVVLEV